MRTAQSRPTEKSHVFSLFACTLPLAVTAPPPRWSKERSTRRGRVASFRYRGRQAGKTPWNTDAYSATDGSTPWPETRALDILDHSDGYETFKMKAGDNLLARIDSVIHCASSLALLTRIYCKRFSRGLVSCIAARLVLILYHIMVDLA